MTGSYDSWESLLDVNIKLMREDFLMPLREGITDYKSGKKTRSIRIFRSVEVLHPIFTPEGIVYAVQMDPARNRTKTRMWRRIKDLRYGSLVCLSCNNFEDIIFATVSKRDRTLLKQGMLEIRIEGEWPFLMPSVYIGKKFTMIESVAYYNAYCYTLNRLSNSKSLRCPLEIFLLDPSHKMQPPPYILEADNKVDIRGAVSLHSHSGCPQDLKSFPILDVSAWDNLKSRCKNLDDSQLEALQAALTRQIALIQGPPGTGKTFLGTKIMEILISHKRKISSTRPILVLCYTNHALDQFLESLLKTKLNISVARIGRQYGKSMNRCSLKEWERKLSEIYRNRRKLPPEIALAREQRATLRDLCLEYNSLPPFSSIHSESEIHEYINFPDNVMPLQIKMSDFGIRVMYWLGLLEQKEIKPTNHTEAESSSTTTETAADHESDYESENSEYFEDSSTGGTLEDYSFFEDYLPQPELVVSEQTVSSERQSVPGMPFSVPDGTDHDPPFSNIPAVNFASNKQHRRAPKVHFETFTAKETAQKVKIPLDTVSNNSGTFLVTKSNYKDKLEPPILSADEEIHLKEVFRMIKQLRKRLPTYQLQPSFHSSRDNELSLGSTSTTSSIPSNQEPVQTMSRPEESNDMPIISGSVVENKHEQSTDHLQETNTLDTQNEKALGEEDSAYRGPIIQSESPLTRAQMLSECLREYGSSNKRPLYHLLSSNSDIRLPFFEKDLEETMKHFTNTCEGYHLQRETGKCYTMKGKHSHFKIEVIGMTTTGAAMNYNMLKALRPSIVLVEEAAEVLESHILTSLTESVEHLILIGDHSQLRPPVASHKLGQKYHLDVSLFERLLKNGLPHVTLTTQHRMRPEIARLISPHIYPQLLNHHTVIMKNDKHVKPIAGDLFFIDHKELERGSPLASYRNDHEANFVVSLALYLSQGYYDGKNITILTPYSGQANEIREILRELKMDHEGILVKVLDEYQGEENKIVIISLVRSNQKNNPGFMKVANRICVALSRAKKGLYCIGNLSLFRCVPLWKKILDEAGKQKAVGEFLELRICRKCGNEEGKLRVKCSEDFNQPFECSRPCSQKCYICKKVCDKTCNLHKEVQRNLKCPPCKTKCTIKCRDCRMQCDSECREHKKRDGHIVCPPCSQRISLNHLCRERHEVSVKCHQKEKIMKKGCQIEITQTQKCGHGVLVRCSQDPNKIRCTEKCLKYIHCTLKCGHKNSCNPQPPIPKAAFLTVVGKKRDGSTREKEINTTSEKKSRFNFTPITYPKLYNT